jgi:Asp-tRNA(Asn)/Glu-tRNA(Gln) amidotransferase A subunit family amidase
MAYFSAVGLGSTLLPGVLWAQAQQQGPEITKEMIAAAEEISGLKFSDDERTAMARSLQQMRGNLQTLHKEPLDQSILPAIVFDPVPPGKELAKKSKALMVRSKVAIMARPGSIEELAYAPVTQLSDLVRSRKVKPSELTDMYLSRLKRLDPQLHFVVNLTEERARAQAKDMDAEISRGKYRGPLHGIPWGAKDLLAVKGYPTTWGAGLYKDQTFDYEATVVKRLDAAGAILVAKLTLGSLAQGNHWWAEYTRNPWIPEQLNPGSSGSSAGPASATAAGCVGFSIGSETNGSITSPSRTCGVSGFRPTFGRVPRSGAMALSWTTDKLGPDLPKRRGLRACLRCDSRPRRHRLLREAVSVQLEREPQAVAAQDRVREGRLRATRAGRHDDTDPRSDELLKVLEAQGAKLDPIEIPTPNYGYLDSIILSAEAGAAFEPDTLNSKIKELESYSTVAQFLPGRAVRAGGRLHQREPRPHRGNESDVGVVLEV